MPRILVVDTEPQVVEVISKSLRDDLDAEVACAPTAQIAAQIIRWKRFDLVFIDVRINGGGVGLAELAANENVPVLLTSGRHEGAVLRRFGFPHLEKPFRSETLRSEATQIMEEAAENIRRVKTSVALLRANCEALGEAMAESRRIVEASRAIVPE
jgi:DNA-binding NtrC family response regulator